MKEQEAGRHPTSDKHLPGSESLQVVREALRGLKFGTVKLIVQDGEVVRVERTENRLVPKITNKG